MAAITSLRWTITVTTSNWNPCKKTSASRVKQATKRNFAWHLIPDECTTDNSPQFDSYEYSCFTHEYRFTIIKSSPYHSRRNGKAKSAVKIAKKILKKSCFEDLYLALFAYQNTPQQGYPHAAFDVSETQGHHPYSQQSAGSTHCKLMSCLNK